MFLQVSLMMKKEKNFFRTLENIYIHRRDVEESLLGVDGEGLANGGVLALVSGMEFSRPWLVWVMLVLCATGRIFFHAHHMLDVTIGVVISFAVCHSANLLLMGPSCSWATLVLVQAGALVGLAFSYKDERRLSEE